MSDQCDASNNTALASAVKKVLMALAAESACPNSAQSSSSSQKRHSLVREDHHKRKLQLETSDSSEDDYQPKAKLKKGKQKRVVDMGKGKEKVYPSSFLRRNLEKNKSKKVIYERDIICLPSWFNEDGLIQIPRRKIIKEYLAVNKLVGKIRLDSQMSEEEIFDEIRSVYKVPMDNIDDFNFSILQPSGGDSRVLLIPELSKSYKWTASTAAGKNSKVPMYILAHDDLKLTDSPLTDSPLEFDEYDGKINEQSVKGFQDVEKKPASVTYVSSSKVYNDYINLVDNSDDEMAVDNTGGFLSLSLNESHKNDDLDDAPIEVLLQQHKLDVLPISPSLLSGDSEYTRIAVRRKYIWEDTIEAFRSNDVTKHLKVTFVGEPAVDDGGPFREYLHMLISQISSNSLLFQGEGYSLVPSANVTELLKNTYKCVGQMFAISLLYGGPCPSFLAPSVVDYILYGLEGVRPTSSEVPCEQIRRKLIELEKTPTSEEFRALLQTEDYDFRYEIGVGPYDVSKLSLANRQSYIASVAVYYCIINIKAQLDQLVEGLSILGVCDLMRANPFKMRNLFLSAPMELNADLMLTIFSPWHSDVGSNARDEEEIVMLHWINLLTLIEKNGGMLKLRNKKGQEENFKISFGDILMFSTATTYPPPSGFNPSPSIKFERDLAMPRADTCANTLILPIISSPVPSKEDYAYLIVYSILNAIGYGQI